MSLKWMRFKFRDFLPSSRDLPLEIVKGVRVNAKKYITVIVKRVSSRLLYVSFWSFTLDRILKIKSFSKRKKQKQKQKFVGRKVAKSYRTLTHLVFGGDIKLFSVGIIVDLQIIIEITWKLFHSMADVIKVPKLPSI